jgi:hypothetical protein
VEESVFADDVYSEEDLSFELGTFLEFLYFFEEFLNFFKELTRPSIFFQGWFVFVSSVIGLVNILYNMLDLMPKKNPKFSKNLNFS